MSPPSYDSDGRTVNAGWVTTFNQAAVVSENRVTPIPGSFDMRLAPLLGCAVTTGLGVISNEAQVRIGESVVVFGIGGVGLTVVQGAAMAPPTRSSRSTSTLTSSIWPCASVPRTPFRSSDDLHEARAGDCGPLRGRRGRRDDRRSRADRVRLRTRWSAGARRSLSAFRRKARTSASTRCRCTSARC